MSRPWIVAWGAGRSRRRPLSVRKRRFTSIIPFHAVQRARLRPSSTFDNATWVPLRSFHIDGGSESRRKWQNGAHITWFSHLLFFDHPGTMKSITWMAGPRLVAGTARKRSEFLCGRWRRYVFTAGLGALCSRVRDGGRMVGITGDAGPGPSASGTPRPE